MTESYGLDFGISNSSIAIVQDGAVQVLPIDENGLNPMVLPSVLFLDRSGTSFIGTNAIRMFVERNTGREIRRRRTTSGKTIETVFGDEWVQFDADTDLPGRFFQSLKTFLKDA